MYENRDTLPDLAKEAFAGLGFGKIAYITEITTDAARRLCPNLAFESGVKVFAVCQANGTPLFIAGNMNLAVGYAIQKRLNVRSVH